VAVCAGGLFSQAAGVAALAIGHLVEFIEGEARFRVIEILGEPAFFVARGAVSFHAFE